jgi:hypothetical protein
MTNEAIFLLCMSGRGQKDSLAGARTCLSTKSVQCLMVNITSPSLPFTSKFRSIRAYAINNYMYLSHQRMLYVSDEFLNTFEVLF